QGAVVQGHLKVQGQRVRAAQRHERRDRNQTARLEIEVGPRPDFAGEEVRNQVSEVGRKPGPRRMYLRGPLLAEEPLEHLGALIGHLSSASLFFFAERDSSLRLP